MRRAQSITCHKRFQLEADSRVVVLLAHRWSTISPSPSPVQPSFFPLLLTFTVPPVWKQLVATWARAVIRARDVDALVDAQLPSFVHSSSVHFTLINICQNSPGPVDVSKGILKGIQNVEVFFFFLNYMCFTFWASSISTCVEQHLENALFKMLLNYLHLKSRETMT